MAEQKSDRFFLNAVTKRNRRLPAPETGRWKGDEGSRDFLSKYAKDIEIEGQIDDPHTVHSVPSVFARPIQFYQALSDNIPEDTKHGRKAVGNHPLHDTIVTQWRGLLGLFALRQCFGFDLKLREYRIPSVKEIDEAREAEKRPLDLNLITILRSQLPKPEKHWERWWLIYCDGQLVGATSPWTIIFTPAEYRCSVSIPWQEDGRLADPFSYLGKKAGKEELAILYNWVRAVLNSHATSDRWNAPTELEEKTSAIKRELEQWQADLQPYKKDQIRSNLSESEIKESPYDFFLRSVIVEGSSLKTSDLFLATSVRVTDGKPVQKSPGTVVFSRKGVDEKLRVYGSTFGDKIKLSDLRPGRGPGKWRATNGAEIPYPYIIAEDLFFPPKLVRLPLSDSALQRGTSEFALPLTPAFFEFFDITEFARKAEFLQVTYDNKKVKAKLRLPLQSGQMLTVEREYDVETDLVSITAEDFPALAIWPDFYSEDWYANFAALAGPTEKVSVFAAPVLNDGKELARTRAQESEETVRIWSSTAPVLGFAIYEKDHGSANETPCGLILRSLVTAPKVPEPNRKWTISVDFGTSSTAIMVSDAADQSAQPDPRSNLFALRGRTQILTKPKPDYAVALRHHFYPSEEVYSPFVTALSTAKATVYGESWRYSPQFFTNVADNQTIGRMIRKIEPNLKWGTDTPIREYLRHLVRQVCCECRAEGVSQIRFRWSYPLALPKNAFGVLDEFWRGFEEDFCDAGTLSIERSEGVAESDAICRRLAWMTDSPVAVRSAALSITIDVGGGSTDIGFWSSTHLLDQVSAKLAGNDMLPQEICMKDETFQRMVCEACGWKWDKTIADIFKQPDYHAMMFNWILTKARTKSGELFDNVDPRKHPVLKAIDHQTRPWSVVRSLIYLFFFGVSYYCALHARKWFNREEMKIQEAQLYFGGRGSALLLWLSTNEQTLLNILTDAFRQALAGNPYQSSIVIGAASPVFGSAKALSLKQEVASGLLSRALDLISPRDERTTIVGEETWRDDPDKPPLDFFTEVDETKLGKLRIQSIDATLISAMISSLERYSKGLNLEKMDTFKLLPTPATVEGRVRTYAAKQLVQPIFFTELGVTMEEFVKNVYRSVTQPPQVSA